MSVQVEGTPSVEDGDPRHPVGDAGAGTLDSSTARRETLVVAGVAAAAYLLTLSSVPALSHDSLTYLLAIEEGGAALLHPHHLAYNALGRAWLELLGPLGLADDPLRALESLNALLGATAVALVWFVLRVRGALGRVAAVAGTAGAGLSFGVWYYSVSVEVYLLSLVLLLATFVALTTARRTRGTIVAVGLLNGLAVLGHQANVLFAVVVAVELGRHVSWRTALARLAAYGAAAAGVVVAAYGAALALVVRPGSPSEAADWFVRYAQEEGYWHLGPEAPVEAAAGFGRALVGGQFAFRLDSVQQRMTEMYGGRSLVDEIFLTRTLSPALVVGLMCLTVSGAVLLFATVVQGLRRRDELPAQPRRLLRPLLTWFAVYALFFCVWEGLNPEFHIPQVTVLWMVGALTATPAIRASGAAAGRPSRRTIALVAAAVCIATANGVGTIVPATDPANDPYALRYIALGEHVTTGDLVVVDHPHLGLGYTARHTDAAAIPATGFTTSVRLDPDDVPAPADIVDRAQRVVAGGHRVAVDAHLVAGASNERARLVGAALTERFGQQWRPVPLPDLRGWYIIDPPPPS